jgi:hypothetical protein
MDNLEMKFYQIINWIVKKLESKLPVAVIELLLIQLFYFVIILIVSVLMYVAPHDKLWNSFEHEIAFIAITFTGVYYIWLAAVYILVSSFNAYFVMEFYKNCKVLFNYFFNKKE